jgi:adenylate cyclase, class 1
MSKLINNLPIDTRNIEEGLDRKQLNFLRQRFLQINQTRFERSCQSLTDRQQQFLTLLPLLFHVNHPLLPGYLSNQVPCGVIHYQPQKNEIQLAKTFARSFHFPKELTIKQPAIDALFVMGSPGTIAQNEISDLDLWICHKIDLSSEKCQLLQHKADLLTEWANKNIHLTLHCFLMQSDAFKTEKNLAFNSEASGTAQYYLLLDEFYRTALWLAGKVPLWWFVPAEREKDYDDYADTLIKKRFLKTNDVIDFGGVARIPAEEYLGAGIWQLYKAIESPYKSVLKLLLLEIYATQENTPLAQPLALNFKQAVYSGVTDANQLDPYVFIYQRIEQYLRSIDNQERLELIRRCFYFKVNRSLSKDSRSSWQAELLKSMISQWSWNVQKLQRLDNRSHWKADLVAEEHRLLVSELSHSYQLLSDLHKQLGLHAAISRDQLTVLGRKLYAVFERRAGKVNLINPGISVDLTEEELFFVQHQQIHPSWSVYTHEPKAGEDPSLALKHSPQLVELLFWCCANGLITISTKLNFNSANFTINFSQHQLISCINQWLPEKQMDINHQVFHAPAFITQILIIANLGNEPGTELHKKGMHLISNRSDALGYSGFRENLVQNLECVYINSWGEIVCRHFEKDALIQMMQYYLQLISKQSFTFPDVIFRCFNSGRGHLIAQRLEELWKQFHYCFFTSNQQRFLFEMADEYIIIESPLTSNEPVFRTHSLAGLLKKLGASRQNPSKVFIDPFALRNTPIPQINQLYSSKAIQLFYYVHQQQADIYLLDDKGAISFHSCQFHAQASLLRPMVYFLQAMVNKLEFSTDSSQLAPKILCYEIQHKNRLANSEKSDWQLELRKLDTEFKHLPLFSIKVIAESDENHQINYFIYCNELEFSSFVFGDRIFERVATYIKQHRKTGQVYPCYITDLDISRHHPSSQGLQLIEFWQTKIYLEERINKAYDAL